jgi:hypothetical protein
MAAGSTYSPIATTTLGSAAASYTFSSIPSTYTDLILIGQFYETAGNNNANIQVGNGSIDTATNYSMTNLRGTGTTAYSARSTSSTLIYWDYTGAGASTGTGIIHFQNYSNTTTYKTCLLRYDNGGASFGGSNAAVGLWRSTSAINTIKINADATTFPAGSTFTLYGIAAA